MGYIIGYANSAMTKIRQKFRIPRKLPHEIKQYLKQINRIFQYMKENEYQKAVLLIDSLADELILKIYQETFQKDKSETIFEIETHYRIYNNEAILRMLCQNGYLESKLFDKLKKFRGETRNIFVHSTNPVRRFEKIKGKLHTSFINSMRIGQSVLLAKYLLPKKNYEKYKMEAKKEDKKILLSRNYSKITKRDLKKTIKKGRAVVLKLLAAYIHFLNPLAQVIDQKLLEKLHKLPTGKQKEILSKFRKDNLDIAELIEKNFEPHPVWLGDFEKWGKI